MKDESRTKQMLSLVFSWSFSPEDCIDAMDLPFLAAHEDPSFLQAKFDGLSARPWWTMVFSLMFSMVDNCGQNSKNM